MKNTHIKLTGKTQKGKQRIKRDGANFVVTEIKDTVLFSDKAGPWLEIQSICIGASRASRWVHKNTDIDFEVTPLD